MSATVASRPITELVMDSMEPRYTRHVYNYLKTLGCTVTPLESGRHKIQFPAGTIEHVNGGQSTQWTYRTTLAFPNGVHLQKYVHAALNPTLSNRTMIAFPRNILDPDE